MNMAYYLTSGAPVSAYGEVIFLLLQDLVIVGLLWSLASPDKQTSLGMRCELVVVLAAVSIVCVMLPDEHRYLIPSCIIPLVFMSRIPQIWSNYTNGHTGQLAFITLFLNFFGTFLRLLTTIQEVGWVMSLLYQLSTSVVLNLVLLFQMCWYWNATNVAMSSKKKVA
ncbi:unnamed protein product [Chrysoparadoxa australica]